MQRTKNDSNVAYPTYLFLPELRRLLIWIVVRSQVEKCPYYPLLSGSHPLCELSRVMILQFQYEQDFPRTK